MPILRKVDSDDWTKKWKCYDCGAHFLTTGDIEFSYCPRCHGGDTGVMTEDGKWYRFSLNNWDQTGE